jgi:hypothetical protein
MGLSLTEQAVFHDALRRSGKIVKTIPSKTFLGMRVVCNPLMPPNSFKLVNPTPHTDDE